MEQREYAQRIEAVMAPFGLTRERVQVTVAAADSTGLLDTEAAMEALRALQAILEDADSPQPT